MKDLAKKISALYKGQRLRRYVYWKIRSDKLYQAVEEKLRDTELPIIDIGCGVGVNAAFLREAGCPNTYFGYDYDEEKIIIARSSLASVYQNVQFEKLDARINLPEQQGNILLLDLLQFFKSEEQKNLLHGLANRVKPGAFFIVRNTIRAKNVRFLLSICGDLLAKISFWMAAAPTSYPDKKFIEENLHACGLVGESKLLTGAFPFNNYIFVFQKRSAKNKKIRENES